MDWSFLETILVGFGFHPTMVQWIMVCVAGASYSICVNGNLHGWFKGKRGLWQGDPLSPYLFTLVMEILILILQRRVRDSDEFQYHHLCEQQKIINLCFPDVLFIFSRGNPSSVAVIMDASKEFKHVLVLVLSIPNSMTGNEKRKAKVAWDSICMPKHEGDLGFSLNDSINNHISDGVWRWPLDLLSRFPIMAQLQVPLLFDDIDDTILWRDVDSVNKVNVADAGKLNANSSSPTTDIRNLGPGPAGLATNEAIYSPKTGTSFASVVSPNAKNSAVGSLNAKHGGSNPSVPAGVNMDNSFASLVRPSATTKDPSFPVVQQYVMNTWRKFGFEKITRNDEGVYLFKFASKAGEVIKVPIWVKLYNVPILAYSEDGLSLIATQIGKPIMLDAFTSSMCMESWGRISFARALIEISASSVLKKEVIMAIPEDEGDGYIKEVVRVEFGHETNLCPKRVRVEIPKPSDKNAKANTMEENDDGFVEVKSRKKKKGADPRSFGGLRLNKPNSKVIWQQKKGGEAKGGSPASPSVREETGDSMQQLKVSEQVDNESMKKAQEPSSSKSATYDVQEEKKVSSSPVKKTWDCINESDTDDEDVFTSYGTSLGGGNQLEDGDFNFYDGYEDQVVDL
uniref:Reverse transcriptase domain, reverse transcriptase zinc-binding domain protein n=1 Tax=Tanacetum cinerariifolium TaxID=118510 RepID=A0A6L2LAM2_TANCI|nr:reverse transcriptase domain, reverse transcriptase zinc-binding domain protein [Tanacetum cinerariifolium]